MADAVLPSLPSFGGWHLFLDRGPGGPDLKEKLAMATMPGELMRRHRLTVDDWPTRQLP